MIPLERGVGGGIRDRFTPCDITREEGEMIREGSGEKGYVTELASWAVICKEELLEEECPLFTAACWFSASICAF